LEDHFIKNLCEKENASIRSDNLYNEKKRSMSPMLKGRRKENKEKSKDMREFNKNNELKTTLQIGKNVNDLIVLNSMFQIKEKDEIVTTPSNNGNETDRCELNENLIDKVNKFANDPTQSNYNTNLN